METEHGLENCQVWSQVPCSVPHDPAFKSCLNKVVKGFFFKSVGYKTFRKVTKILVVRVKVEKVLSGSGTRLTS